MKEQIKANKGKIAFGAAAVIILAVAFIMGGRTGSNDIAVDRTQTKTSSNTIVSEISHTESIVVSSSAHDEKEAVSDISKTSVNSYTGIETQKPEIVENSPESIIEETSVVSEIYEPIQLESSEESETQKISEISEISENKESIISVSSASSYVKETSKIINESSVQQEISSIKHSCCSLSIDCSTALKNEKLSDKKRRLQPENGVILSSSSVEFTEGASVFDVLKELCERENIRLEFSLIPLSGGAYIEGINNLYEFDCGNISGWMYSVNGEFPNCGCSDYKLSDGDCVRFLYSCDLGKDIGNEFRG